jgi:hypothetical protein
MRLPTFGTRESEVGRGSLLTSRVAKRRELCVVGLANITSGYRHLGYQSSQRSRKSGHQKSQKCEG